MNLIEAHQFCNYNRESLSKSEICGCFYCLMIFSPNEIREWIDRDEKTALCPKCGIDSILGDYDVVFDKLFLKKMHKHWF